MGIQFDSRAKGKKYHGYYWDRGAKKKVSVGMYMTREEAEAAVSNAVAALNLRMEESDLKTLENKRKKENYATDMERKKFNGPTFNTEKRIPLTAMEKFEESLNPQQKPPVDLKFGQWKNEAKEKRIATFRAMNYTRETHEKIKDEQKPPPDLKFGQWKKESEEVRSET